MKSQLQKKGTNATLFLVYGMRKRMQAASICTIEDALVFHESASRQTAPAYRQAGTSAL